MYIRCFNVRRRFCRTDLHAGISLVWIAGLALGCLADRFYGDVYRGFFEGASLLQPGLLGLAAVTVFPLLISAFAVWINPFLLYIPCLLRGFTLGLALCACGTVYGQAGPMMFGLLVFSLLTYSPVLLWYWYRALTLESWNFHRDTWLCFGIGLVILSLDYWIIAPFLQEIMIF